MTPAEADRMRAIHVRLDGAEGPGWDIAVVPGGLKVETLGDGDPPGHEAARFLRSVRDDVDWLLARLAAYDRAVGS